MAHFKRGKRRARSLPLLVAALAGAALVALLLGRTSPPVATTDAEAALLQHQDAAAQPPAHQGRLATSGARALRDEARPGERSLAGEGARVAGGRQARSDAPSVETFAGAAAVVRVVPLLPQAWQRSEGTHVYALPAGSLAPPGDARGFRTSPSPRVPTPRFCLCRALGAGT